MTTQYKRFWVDDILNVDRPNERRASIHYQDSESHSGKTIEVIEVKALEDLQKKFDKLVDSVTKYLKLAPTDGWHFSDCDSSEDNYEEEMPCSCGVSAAEAELFKVLKELGEGV